MRQHLRQLANYQRQSRLEQAKALQSFLNDVVAALEKEELPEKIERPAEQEINNPFYNLCMLCVIFSMVMLPYSL